MRRPAATPSAGPLVPPALLLCAALVLGAASMAGCYAEDAPQAPGRPVWQVHGSFTEQATDADARDLEARLRPWDAHLAVRESYPMQYTIEVEAAAACDEVRAMLAARPYVATVGPCRAVDPDGSPGPDAPVSSTPDGRRRVP